MANDGGPAFPKPYMDGKGISFRDVAAIHFASELLGFDEKQNSSELAMRSYDIAQALTDERQRILDDEQAG